MSAVRAWRIMTYCVVGGAAMLVAAGGCGEDLLAPGVGTCPNYCPPEQLQVVDSVLLDNITSDSTFSGYVQPYEASALQVYRDSTAAAEANGWAVILFRRFSDSLLISSGDTTHGAVLATDSFRLEIPVRGRTSATGIELLVYRLPLGLDSTTTAADLAPYFADSTLLATVPIADSVTGSSVFATIDALAFPDFAADSNRTALGIAMRTPTGFLNVGATEGSSAATLSRYVQVDSAGVSVPRVEGKQPEFDSFLGPPESALTDGERGVGGAPSARTLLRFALPTRILDSSTVVRATLVLVPTGPVLGAPGDSIVLIAQGLNVDAGAKSPLRTVPSDSVALRIGFVLVGASDTVRLDVTDVVIGWVNDSTRPPSLAVRAVPEGATFAEYRFAAVSSGADRPRLHVTFIPPLTLGGR